MRQGLATYLDSKLIYSLKILGKCRRKIFRSLRIKIMQETLNFDTFKSSSGCGALGITNPSIKSLHPTTPHTQALHVSPGHLGV